MPFPQIDPDKWIICPIAVGRPNFLEMRRRRMPLTNAEKFVDPIGRDGRGNDRKIWQGGNLCRAGR
jgi:hypothetical protein